MRYRYIIALILLLLTSPVQGSPPMEQWQYNKTVTAPGAGVALVQLDREVLSYTRDDLGDLRVLSPQGQEIPYQIMPMALLGEEVYHTAKIVNNVVRDQEFSSITFALDVSRLSNRIVLEMNGKEDFLREVIIEGSTDNQVWRTIKKDKIFAVGPDIIDTELVYPDADYCYIRVTIAAKGQKPLPIKGGSIGYKPGGSKILTPLSGQIVETKQEQGITSLILELPVKATYIDQVKLAVTGRNYNREVQIFDSNDRKNWRNIGQGHIFQYQWPGNQATENTLQIGQIAGRYLKLHINNQDSPPLQIDNCEVLGELPKILVDLPAGTSRIWYGNAQGQSPHYDLERFAHLINQKELPILVLGKQESNPNYQPARKPWTEEHKGLLNGVIILLAFVLGSFIVNLMRKKP